MVETVCGTYAKSRDDGSLVIFDENDHVKAAFASGEWVSMTSKNIPFVTINTERGEEVAGTRLTDNLPDPLGLVASMLGRLDRAAPGDLMQIGGVMAFTVEVHDGVKVLVPTLSKQSAEG